MKFIIGIGNPGKEYDKTRHNVGFWVVEKLAAAGVWKKKNALKSVVSAVGELGLAKPETFVNNTGEAVEAIRREHGLGLEDFLIVCDDVNLSFGKLRLRPSGSAGGHHGLESVIASTGSTEFARLRIGVGGENMPKDLTGYVLDRFLPSEEKELPEILKQAAAACQAWSEEGFKAAQDTLSRNRR